LAIPSEGRVYRIVTEWSAVNEAMDGELLKVDGRAFLDQRLSS
jgi:hypothetical protein